MRIYIYIYPVCSYDGVINIQGKSIVAILYHQMKIISPCCVVKVSCTNNLTEYEAHNIGIHATPYLKIKDLKVCGNSILIISQTTVEWRFKTLN